MIKYRITSLVSVGNELPNPVVSAVFPAFDGWETVLSADGREILVTAPSPQTPVDLGPLVKVEVVSAE